MKRYVKDRNGQKKLGVKMSLHFGGTPVAKLPFYVRFTSNFKDLNSLQ